MGFLSLIIQMGLNATGFETGLKRAESSASRFSKNVNSSIKAQIGAALSVSALAAAVKHAAEYAGHLNDVSAQLDIGTTKLQEYAYAAAQTGGTMDDFENAAKKLATTRLEALKDPSGEMAKNFKALGVSIDDLKSKKLDALIDQIGGAFQRTNNVQQLLGAGLATMGKSSVPVIGAMREGLAEFAAELHAWNAIVSTESLQALDDLGDKFSAVAKGGLASFMEGLGKTVIALKGVKQLITSTMAGVGGYWGARFAGASDKEAKKIGYNARIESVAEGVADDQSFLEKVSRRKQITEGLASLDLPSLEKKDIGFQKANVNSLQQIGAFSGVDPIVREVQRTNTFQQQILSETKAVRKNTDSGFKTTDSF